MKEESKLIELFKKYPGIAARIRRSFAYHYDQIQREIESEVATINKDDAATIIDYTYPTRINGMNTFLLQVNQIPITTQTQVQPSTSTYVPKTN